MHAHALARTHRAAAVTVRGTVPMPARCCSSPAQRSQSQPPRAPTLFEGASTILKSAPKLSWSQPHCTPTLFRGGEHATCMLAILKSTPKLSWSQPHRTPTLFRGGEQAPDTCMLAGLLHNDTLHAFRIMDLTHLPFLQKHTQHNNTRTHCVRVCHTHRDTRTLPHLPQHAVAACLPWAQLERLSDAHARVGMVPRTRAQQR